MKNKVRELVLKILDELDSDLDIYEICYFRGKEGMVLQVLLQADHNISTNDLVEVNRCLSNYLDEIEDEFNESYTLEVASAGLEREIRNDRELANAIHKDIKVNCYKKFQGNKFFLGKLISFDSAVIDIEQRNGNIIKIPRELISKLNFAVIM